MLESLDDVLGSADSPLDVKEPMALKFLPSTLLEELRVVKTGEKLSKHQLFTMLMDDSWRSKKIQETKKTFREKKRKAYLRRGWKRGNMGLGLVDFKLGVLNNMPAMGLEYRVRSRLCGPFWIVR